MRYISHIHELALITKPANVTPALDDPNPVAKYRFYAGELIVGDPTTNSGAGNAIDATDLYVLYPSGSNDLEKAGLGKIFFEAPYIAASSATLTAGKAYIVLKGQVTWNGGTYGEGEFFRVNTGDPTSVTEDVPGSIIALDISNFDIGTEPHRYFEHKIIQAWYKVNNLVHGDEAEWDASRWATRQPGNRNPWTWTR
jgi:hypothetical protein